jgi:hypothetical protein
VRALALVALLALAGCGTTGTDRYYSALETLSGVREAVIATCAAIPQPTRAEQCGPLRASFFEPSDLAVEALEAARSAAISSCVPDDGAPACKDAGRVLSRAAAGLSALTEHATRWLAARGVQP